MSGDWRGTLPRFQPQNFDNNLRLVSEIEAIAKKKRVTTSQLVLAWLRKQSRVVHLLPGTRSVDRVKENLVALEVELSDEEDRDIRKACERCVVVGGRYPEAMDTMQTGETPELEMK